MFDSIIAYSVRNKPVVGFFVLALIAWGVYSLRQIPIDAIPDITNNQVQVITVSPTLATPEVERYLTTPIEYALQNVQDVVEIRSISRFGLSVVTVVFEEDTDVYFARQLVSERLVEVASEIPEGLGSPEMAPVSTGLGEVYQYTVRPAPGYEDSVSLTELRTAQDWIVRRQLSGIEGVVEVNTLGGYLKEYEVAVDPNVLKARGITLPQLFEAIERSNASTGGAYIERTAYNYYIRSEGTADDLQDIANIVVDVRGGTPVRIGDVAEVGFGHSARYGAATANGEEVVVGTVMMLRGANAAEVTDRVEARMAEIRASLPEGIAVEPYLNREDLVSRTIATVRNNLLEGGLIVVFVLVLLLGNWRAGLVVASVIPLSLLFAISMMNVLGISANLMSLGALDFGLVVDGSVIIVEAIVHRVTSGFAGRRMSQAEMDAEVTGAAVQIRSSAAFGEIIILIVYLPLLTLVGIEGKMFRPMAETVMLAIAGALVLSITYVPAVTALVLRRDVSDKTTIADRITGFAYRLYRPLLGAALRFKVAFVVGAFALFALSLYGFSRLGGEFIPTLEEGDLAMQQILPPGASLSQSVATSKLVQETVLREFPEVREVVTKIGAAEIPTDPMPVEIGDGTLVMAPKDEWTTARTRQGMFAALEEQLEDIPGVGYEFSQPIQMRFNELMTGAKADIAIKLFGEDLDVLAAKATEAEAIIRRMSGVGTVKVEQTVGMPQVVIDYDADRLAQYGLRVRDVNEVVRAGFAGGKAGTVYEGDRRFDLVVRLREANRAQVGDVSALLIPTTSGGQVPLSTVADVRLVDAPMQISREDTRRRVVIGVNVGDTDTESLVEAIRARLDAELTLPAGYYFVYGGQFENLQAARARLAIAVPVALFLIIALLYFTFGSFTQALLIFTAVPLSAIGAVWALQLRDMPFSISAGVGFIALFGVAVLNGIVLIGEFNRLRDAGIRDVGERILRGTEVRLRPVLMTASVASLGFLPMALSNSGGAEVQRPLATVVIGGLVTATFLTLVILPILYAWVEAWRERRRARGAAFAKTGPLAVALLSLTALGSTSRTYAQDTLRLTLDSAVALALGGNPQARAARLALAAEESLQALPYVPGTTNLSGEYEGLTASSATVQQRLTFTQTFVHPAGNRALNRRQDALALRAGIDVTLTDAQVTRAVRNQYYELQQRSALAALVDTLIDVYERYYYVADARASAGAANRLDALTIESRLERQRLRARQLDIDIAYLARGLGQLVGSGTAVLPADQFDFVDLSLGPTATPDVGVSALSVRRAEADVVVTEAQVAVIAAERRPSLTAGAAVQRLPGAGIVQAGPQFGLQWPLFARSIDRRREAQTVAVEAARVRAEASALDFRLELTEVLRQLERNAASAAYYQVQLDELVPEVTRIARLNYRAGELTYLELLNALALLDDNGTAYLDAVLAHNRAVADYLYLTTQ